MEEKDLLPTDGTNEEVREETKTDKNKLKSCILAISTAFFTVLFSIVLFAMLYLTQKININATGWDAVMFTLQSDLSGADPGIILQIVFSYVLPAFVCAAVISYLLIGFPYLLAKMLKTRDWKEKLSEPKYKLLQRLISLLIALALFLSTTLFALFKLNIVHDVALHFMESTIYDDYYVDPVSVEITFPEEKRNLIYIFLESMENSYMDVESGGALDKNLLPNLTELASAQENVNFSFTEGIGGPRTATGSTWTIAAMISQTAGIPLRMPANFDTNALDQFTEVFPGVTTINDIFEQNGYNQALLVGSNAKFGGRYGYFTQHGVKPENVFDIYDAQKAQITVNGKTEHLLPSRNHWYGWGMEDHYLFSYAKDLIPKMAQQGEPFVFTMLTVDTHFPRGYTCQYCGTDHDEQYENVVACSDKQIAQFVEWIKQQDFYENTTVILVGDHFTMDNEYLGGQIPGEYMRTVYNCILNPAAEPIREKNREFTTFDMFPTTLAALGCTIEGDRLGLGTNLFSEEETLCEQKGFQYICDELGKKSDFYYDNLFYGTCNPSKDGTCSATEEGSTDTNTNTEN